MEPIIDSVTEVLRMEFPGCVVELEMYEANQVYGSISWSGFEGVDQLARQKAVRKALKKNLSAKQQAKYRVMILTFIPEELTVGY